VQVGLDQEITEAVITRFVADNHLRVVAESEANALLTGVVTDYKNTVFGFTGREQAQEYRVTISVAVRLMDKVKNRELWRDENMVKTQNYYVISMPGQTAQDEVSGRQEAIRKIADEILTRTIENW
jgi:Lipopolysaccharide-assembly